MLALYPSGTIDKFQIRFCGFKTTVFGPLINSSVSPSLRVAWSNVESYHSSFSPKGQIHHLRKWMEFISAGVNAYSLGCTDEDLRKELIAMKESGLELERMESYHGSTQTKSKISLSE
ncbi:hypothetical protein CARUB_v10021498mg, partial [Capsella rubella]